MKFVVLFAAYLLGSIPFSYLVTRLKTGKDIRDIGSGNVGATNVLRTTGKLPALLALILDVGKGAASVILASRITGDSAMGPPAGFFAMLGHAYPVFLNFRGGKSVATGAGAYGLLCPFAIGGCLIVFGIMLSICRIVGLSSIIAAASFPLSAWLLGSSKPVILWGGLSAGLIIFRHQENIRELFEPQRDKKDE
jgi:glycerol-3-phosphate acyltransferase PlsY